MNNKNNPEKGAQSNSLNPSFDDIPKLTKPDILNPQVQLIGQGGIVHSIFEPLQKLNIIQDQSLHDFQRKIEQGTARISLENRDNSKIGLALKTLEDSKYQLDSEDLRELFANLISSTLDNSKNNKIKPSFSSVLKDLTTEDAQLVKLFSKEKDVPLVSVRVEDAYGTGINLEEDILIFDSTLSRNRLSLYSLERLGIISLDPFTQLSSSHYQKRYIDFENNSLYSDIKNKLPIIEEEFICTSIQLVRGTASLTPFGEAFVSCII